MTKFEKDVLQALKEIKEALVALKAQTQVVYVPSVQTYIPPVAPYIGDPPYPYRTTICGGTNSSINSQANS